MYVCFIILFNFAICFKYFTLFLYIQGNASLDIPNHRGATPLGMLQNNPNAVWIGSKVSERVRERSTSKSNFLRRITYDRVSIL